MKKLLCTILAGGCLLLMGCPLQTDSPIQGDAVVSMPSWLQGRWTEIKETKPAATYEIKADPSGHSGLIIKTIGDNGKPDNETARTAILSAVKGRLFLSVYDKGDSELNEPGYYHYAIRRSDGEGMELTPLKEHVVLSTTSGDELAAYIAGHSGSEEYLDRTATERYRKGK